MSDDDRRHDDRRIDDIASSVHRIDQSLSHIGDRLDRSEQRIGENEMRVMQVEAEHKALEKVMAADNRRIAEKIDGVKDSVTRDIGGLSTKLNSHLSAEEGFQRKSLFFLVSTLVTVVGTVGWFVFTKALEHT